MLDVFKECYVLKRIFSSGRCGTIVLIPKKNRDLRMVKNWRPIILLCADYKILAKVIANHFKVSLNAIIHYDQSGFLKGRSISDNIRKVIDTVRICDRKKLNAILISLDFKKAFDRVDYTALSSALKFLNFGPEIVGWIEVLYKDFSLCTMNNGYFSLPFIATRGLFQGNPFSCYSFLVIIEILAIKIRSNKQIEGVKIGSLIQLLSMFADDLSLFVSNKEKVWHAVRNMIEDYENISGLKVNYEKSTVYRPGSVRNTIARWYSKTKLSWADIKPDTPINVYTRFCLNTAKSKFSLVSPVADW